jgi:type IV secretion system protein VirB8
MNATRAQTGSASPDDPPQSPGMPGGDDGKVQGGRSYYQAAGSWAADRQEALRRSRRTAWAIAAAACTVAVLEAVALILLMPLKTVVPYTLLVDRQTGFVQALDPLNPERVDGNTALTHSLLAQYVIARESFDAATVQDNYRKVALWSAGLARNDYVAGMQASNPSSPLASLPRSTTIAARVKSVSSLGRQVALVRFETERRDRGGSVQPQGSWVALVRYRYTSAPMQLEDRLLNPLGFQVTSYRRDQEALAPQSSARAVP